MQPESSKAIKFFSSVLLASALTACAGMGGASAKNKESADVHLQLGVRYMGMNKLELAKENLLVALKKDPDNVKVHNALAFLYEKINLYDEADDHYETGLKLAPDDLSAQNNYGRFLCERGKYEEGVALLTQASSTPLNDRPWLALTNLGRCHVGMGQPQQAETNFRQALDTNAAYAPALLEMQKLSYKKGEYWAAKGYLQRYLAVAPHTAETLWHAMQAERALGNQEPAEEYRQQLLEKFPLSDEAKKTQSVKR
ncbi:type IV pilus biogenesis/stability protein PilW [Methylobacter sp. YRD-M1]|uniref:type IV pilus biogenesis/stability protein PilW n=1 Tax=Methylobacter sp. YRD-M1 TaxID=2911520 RepID=UPI00227BD46C|nr:type IV pilus biogenesis/stability protein PilW [Methylobacter sp. YRD-M1]WAK01427.1 type IV pilus biogenesis/stability protein PilW [Methylobacter sp. YRD-M1]